MFLHEHIARMSGAENSNKDQTRVLFVEDDTVLREASVQALELEGYGVDAFESADEALAMLSRDFAGVVVTDIRLPGMDGLEFFDKVKELDDELPVIFTTGHGDVAMAVEAMHNGALDFLTKPYSSAQLFDAIKRGAVTRRLILENRKLRSELDQRNAQFVLGSSAQTDRLNRMIADVAATDIDLMIIGESGTGKNHIARKIHETGPRAGRPFVVIDGGIAAHSDAELLIFGRAPGAKMSRSGLIEKANGGTVLLDGIGSIPRSIQARLLSLVENRSFLPLDGDRVQLVDIRIITASQGGSDAVQSGEGSLVSRLFHHLSGIAIKLPSLGERRHAIPEIFQHFVAEYEAEFEKKSGRIGVADWHHLTNHNWPGNLRELSDFARSFVLGLSHVAHVPLENHANSSFKQMVAGFERGVLEDALRANSGHVTGVADGLGMQRKTLYDKLTKYGLKPANFRAGPH